jgi:hypothetical protein
MRRVYSRQRLVSWDAFDATSTLGDDRSDTTSGGASLSGYETSIMAFQSTSLGSNSDMNMNMDSDYLPMMETLPQIVGDFPLKRKRTSQHKQEPVEQEPVLLLPNKPPQHTLPTVSSDSSFVTALSTTSSLSSTSTFIDIDLSSEIEPNVNVISKDPAEIPVDEYLEASEIQIEQSNANANANANAFLSLLNSDVQMHIFTFLDVDSIRSTMQINHSTRNLLLSDASETLWKKHCSRQWNWLDLDVDAASSDDSKQNTNVTLQDALKLPTAAGISPFCNLSLLLSLASKNVSSHVDESMFVPCRWSRSLRRYTPRRNGATSQNQVLLQAVTTGTGESAVQFIGAVGQGDRCIRGDQPLPRPEQLVPVPTAGSDPNHKDQKEQPAQWQCTLTAGNRGRAFLSRIRNRGRGRHRDSSRSSGRSSSSSSENVKAGGRIPIKPSPTNNWRPFVAPFCTAKSDGAAVVQLTPRLISYFEVSILEPPAVSNDATGTGLRPPPNTRPVIPSTNTSECVAVGLASHDFSLHTRMPGWDPNSFGYHGDDGGIFHASGSMVQQYGPTYGVGDVVGCGIDFLQGHLFYTLNGKYLGAAFSSLSTAILQQDWYPVVGLDSNCLVHCNFGCDKPFCFDLSGMIQEQKERLVEGITVVSPKPNVSS